MSQDCYEAVNGNLVRVRRFDKAISRATPLPGHSWSGYTQFSCFEDFRSELGKGLGGGASLSAFGPEKANGSARCWINERNGTKANVFLTEGQRRKQGGQLSLPDGRKDPFD